jgi:16S rRNA C967 or C1407 C5-methylase (RsmB/RsmF family)
VRVEGVDVTAMRVQPAQFDAVLVDAPCSTDRHTLLASPTELEHWTPGRFRRDARRQIALLLQALRLVRVGGTVLYATCSLSNAENDAVIAAVRAQCDKWKQKGRSSEQGVQLDFAVEPIGLADSSMPTAESTVSSPVLAPLPIGEPTAFGPLYMSKLRRLA